MNIVAIVSGGLDSITLAYKFVAEQNNVHLFSVNYGQRHRKELEFARQCADDLSVPITVADLSSLRTILRGSALTDDIPVPEGHYAAPSMKQTIVPNRNAIFLSLAFGLAVSHGFDAVAIGVHSGDHPVYPDCREEFIRSFEEMEDASIGYNAPKLLAPFLYIEKKDVVKIGASVGVPFEKTWSCYNGADIHCGKCGTCVERREAFMLAGVFDPTIYMGE